MICLASSTWSKLKADLLSPGQIVGVLSEAICLYYRADNLPTDCMKIPKRYAGGLSPAILNESDYRAPIGREPRYRCLSISISESKETNLVTTLRRIGRLLAGRLFARICKYRARFQTGHRENGPIASVQRLTSQPLIDKGHSAGCRDRIRISYFPTQYRALAIIFYFSELYSTLGLERTFFSI